MSSEDQGGMTSRTFDFNSNNCLSNLKVELTNFQQKAKIPKASHVNRQLNIINKTTYSNNNNYYQEENESIQNPFMR